MANPNGAKGSQFERDLVDYFRQRNYQAEQLRTKGTLDEGDMYAVRDGHYYLVEAKATQRINLPQGLKELEVEHPRFMKNRGIATTDSTGLLVVKRRNASIGQAYVVTTLDRFFWPES